MLNQLFTKNSEVDRKSSEYAHKKQFGDDALLILSGMTSVVALVGIIGFIWRELYFIARYALIYAMFLSPAIFVICLRDVLSSGINWKRVIAVMLSISAVAIGILAFHEVLSTTPFSRRH